MARTQGGAWGDPTPQAYGRYGPFGMVSAKIGAVWLGNPSALRLCKVKIDVFQATSARNRSSEQRQATVWNATEPATGCSTATSQLARPNAAWRWQNQLTFEQLLSLSKPF